MTSERPDQIPAELADTIRRESSARGIAIAAVLDYLRFPSSEEVRSRWPPFATFFPGATSSLVVYKDRGDLNQKYWKEVDYLRDRIATQRTLRNLQELSKPGERRWADRIERIKDRARENVDSIRNHYN